MEFETLTEAALSRLRPFLEKTPYRICDLTVGGIFLWRACYRTEYAVRDDLLFTRLYDREGRVHYNLPLGGDAARGVQLLLREVEHPLRFCTVPTEALFLFEEYGATVTPHRELFDYLYDAEAFTSLAGKRYAGQRNHVNRFLRTFGEAIIEPITPDNIAGVRAFFEALPTPSEGSAADEHAVVDHLLATPHFYGMTGGVLRAEGKIVGFSFGERVGDTLYVHVEKADRTCPGAHQALASRFAAYAGEGARFINREDDAGDEGLRTAKLALHPVCLLEKHTVELP